MIKALAWLSIHEILNRKQDMESKTQTFGDLKWKLDMQENELFVTISLNVVELAL